MLADAGEAGGPGVRVLEGVLEVEGGGREEAEGVVGADGREEGRGGAGEGVDVGSGGGGEGGGGEGVEGTHCWCGVLRGVRRGFWGDVFATDVAGP